MIARVYGIPNCDTIKKTRRWMDENSVEYEFHDYKKLGVSASTLNKWCDKLGWETFLNKRGTTWRKLDDADKENLDQAKAVALMQLHTSLIKRPVTEYGQTLLVGFNEPQYTEVFE
jgi:Spx/MgsR family transcriptional regulator